MNRIWCSSNIVFHFLQINCMENLKGHIVLNINQLIYVMLLQNYIFLCFNVLK
jgi:hypothetical protein